MSWEVHGYNKLAFTIYFIIMFKALLVYYYSTYLDILHNTQNQIVLNVNKTGQIDYLIQSMSHYDYYVQLQELYIENSVYIQLHYMHDNKLSFMTRCMCMYNMKMIKYIEFGISYLGDIPNTSGNIDEKLK